MPSPPRQLCFSAATSLTLIFRKEYSLDELKQKPAPEGVDPSRLEAYLNEADFQVKRTSFAVFIFTFIICWFVVTRSIRRSVKAFSLSLLCCCSSCCFWHEVSWKVRKEFKGSTQESSLVRVLHHWARIDSRLFGLQTTTSRWKLSRLNECTELSD